MARIDTSQNVAEAAFGQAAPTLAVAQVLAEAAFGDAAPTLGMMQVLAEAAFGDAAPTLGMMQVLAEVAWRPLPPQLRVPGSSALIRLQRDGEAVFDISGVGADGRSRANDFVFSISGNTVEAGGYGEDWIETVLTGQSRIAGAMTAFYNTAADEAEDYLWEMWKAQHLIEDCDDVAGYTLYVMPEGDCEGKTKWTIGNVVIKTLEFPIRHSDLLVIAFGWSAWKVSRERIVG